MSYNDTLAKLQRVLNKIESLTSDFMINRTVATDHFKKSIEELNSLLESLNYEGWRFCAEGFSFGKMCVHSKVLCEDDVVRDLSRSIEVANHAKRSLKKEIIRSMLGVFNSYYPPAKLDTLIDQVLKPAEIVEARITESLCSDIYDIFKDYTQGYADLEKEWKALEPDIKEYVDRVKQLLAQVSEEYFDEKRIVKGDYLYTDIYLDPLEVAEDLTGDEVALILPDQKVRRHSIDKIYTAAKIATWEKNHPQFRVDDLLYPLNTVLEQLFVAQGGY